MPHELDEEDVREIALRLRELYPDDDEFEAAMQRFMAELAAAAEGEGGG